MRPIAYKFAIKVVNFPGKLACHSNFNEKMCSIEDDLSNEPKICSVEDNLSNEPQKGSVEDDCSNKPTKGSIQGDLGKEPNKNFSNAVITWEIESFSLITSTEKLICSPTIKLIGPVETLWQINLHIPVQKNRLLLKVEMLQNEFQISSVILHWAFCLLDETEKVAFSNERTFTYKPKTRLTLEYIDLKRALAIASKKKYDNLILKCRMLVEFHVKVESSKCTVAGVEHLSNSLHDLPTSFLYHDTTTTINNVGFSLHKAMLFFRGTKLVRFMEQSTDNADYSFPLSKTKAATAVFRYLYTGNLKFILDYPCLTIYNYIEHLEIPELENVYSPQRITVASKVELKEYVNVLKVLDLKNLTTNVFKGPEFKIKGMESRFQLSLSVKESKDDPRKKSLTIEVTLIESDILLVLSIGFAFGKDENEILCTRRVHGVIGPKERLGVTLMEDDCPEMNDLFLNETLLIKVHINRSIGGALSYIAENENPTLTRIPNDKSLLSLSKIMGEIKRTAIYSDFHFEVDDQVIKAHKFLAAARSPLMKELLRGHYELERVKVHDCTKEVFEEFLCYLYTGTFARKDVDKLIELYNLGKRYIVDDLSEIVLQLLSQCINEVNMLRILIFADEVEEYQLKKIAFHYVASKRDILQKHDYDMLRSKAPNIYRLFQNSLEIKL